MDLRRFEWSPCQAAKVRNVSKVGSQFKSFLFNVSPTEHAVCGTAAGLSAPITNYPSLLEFPRPWTPGSPQNPPSALALVQKSGLGWPVVHHGSSWQARAHTHGANVDLSGSKSRRIRS